MSTVRAISGAGGKGPACFLLETPHARLLLDLGYGPQPGVWPDVGGIGPVDAIVLTHGHNDHAAGLKLAASVGNPPVHATAPVLKALHTDLETHELPVTGTASVCGITLRTGRSGHAPGGVWLHADIGGGLLYTGDYSVESLIYEFDAPPQAATVILDTSYGVYDAPLEDGMKALARLLAAPPALLPVPVIGRGPEIAYHLATERREPLRIGDDLRAAISSMVAAPDAHGVRFAVVDTLERIARDSPHPDERPGIVLAGAADGGSGKSAEVIAEWRDEGVIVFTGYMPPGSPAQRLTDAGRARYVHWNVHPRLRDNVALVRSTGARTVLPAFGDRKHRAAWTEAFAPAHIAIEEPIDIR
ncbi:MAG TPA: MBL fold metallo-hydrolase [Burkholderiales bacterium]|nr:MBL fold metallo-hydrolase [Burkholderiales bacterium]